MTHEGNKHRVCIRDNYFDYRQPHQHIHLKEKKPDFSNFVADT